jgi:hypothetical protein
MHRVLPIILLALLSCAFALPETPAERADRVKEERAWKKLFVETYDLDSLHVFLKSQIAAIPLVEGVDLRKSKIERKWWFGGLGVSCGDWSFSAKSISSPEFNLSWTYEEIRRNDDTILQRSVTFACLRESKSVFRMISVCRSDRENVIIQP